MTWTPRPIEPDELPAVIDLLAVGFGIGPTSPPDHRAEVTAVHEPDRIFVVEDEGRIVATAAAHSFQVALPGGGAVPMAGVTEVVVSPTHRRRGLLSALLDVVHGQAVERDEPLAGLTASEGGIYRRFGYGVAARFQSVRVDAHRAAEAEALGDADADGVAAGRFRFVTEDEAEPILPAVWDRHWRRTPGEVDRTPGFWVQDRLDPEHDREGASKRYIVVHEDDAGRADGYVTYRIAQDWGHGGTNHEARVLEVAAASDPVESALIRFLLDIDLVGTLTWQAPVDAPLRWRLADPRALTVTAERDHLWFRPLDVPACLTARGYAGEGELVVEVVDERGSAGGTYVLATGRGGADCGPTDRTPDLAVTVADLGSVLAGGTTWATLRRAGRVVAADPVAVDRADALFRPERAAFCATDF
jgi:predicted acetyltransferase